MLGRLRVPIPTSVKLENNEATLTAQNTKVGTKAIYTLETVSLKREEEEEEEGRVKRKREENTVAQRALEFVYCFHQKQAYHSLALHQHH